MRVLDLFSGAGGAAMGYVHAGHTVIGVDIIPQPNYPFTFWRINAIELLQRLIDGEQFSLRGDEPIGLDDFDAIHASPPCQRYSAGTRALLDNTHPDLVDITRQLLISSELPYVIENVEGAPLYDPFTLCGRMFGMTAIDDDGTLLQLDRHRMFETSFPIAPPPTCRPHDRRIQVGGVYGGARRNKDEARYVRGGGYVPASLDVLRELMGIEWMEEKELFLAIPPVYTEWIGERLWDVNRGE